jgi:hypothetical protein
MYCENQYYSEVYKYTWFSVVTHTFSVLYMVSTWWWLAEAETCSEKHV